MFGHRYMLGSDPPWIHKRYFPFEELEWNGGGTDGGFNAINDISLSLEKPYTNMMKILRFGKAGTVCRKFDQITWKTMHLEFLTY